MTYEEAYKILTEHTRNYVGLKDVEALEVAIGAVKKQIPEKPIAYTVGKEKLKIRNGFFGKGTTVYKCPSCKEFTSIIDKHCHICGQALDWSERK